MSSSHSDEPPAQGVCDAAAAIQPQRNVTQPSPLDLGSPQAPHQPPPPPQEGQENEARQDGGIIPERNEGPSVVHWARKFLDGTPFLVEASHLPREDLDRVTHYVFGLSQEAGLPINETEQATVHLLTMGNQARWDVGTLEGFARMVVNNTTNLYRLRNAATDGENDVAHFFTEERVYEFIGGNRVALKRRIVLPPRVDQGSVDPPPQRGREQVVRRRGAKDTGTLYSVKFESRNVAHFQVKVLVSAALLRNIVYSSIIVVALAVVKGFTHISYAGVC